MSFENKDGVAARVTNLSKSYQIYNRPEDRLKQSLYPRLSKLIGKTPKSYYKEFWALHDISFEIKTGETVGIIGRNGSGKSTLLQMMCGTLHPTEGRVETHGRIAALLELGSGFNPEFTGRENVYMNAAILGLTQKEIDSKFDDIIAFANIGEFVNQPVKTYSSGMMLRLAFAVQSQIEPDILIVDEALAVGDAQFQAKCFERLKQLKKRGTSILLVTHSSEQIVRHCNRAILLDHGKQIIEGKPKDIVNRYMDLLFGNQNKQQFMETKQDDAPCENERQLSTYQLSCSDDIFSSRPGYNAHEYRWGDRAVSILDFYLAKDNQTYPAMVESGAKITLGVSIKFHEEIHHPILGFRIKTKEGINVYGTNSEMLKCKNFKQLGKKNSVVHIESSFIVRLTPGDYFISWGLASRQDEEIIPHDRRYDSIYLQISPHEFFFGLANCDLQMITKEVAA